MNIRDRLKHTAPPWGFWLSTLLLCLLVFAGCTGCGQKTPPAALMPAQHTAQKNDTPPTPQENTPAPAPPHEQEIAAVPATVTEEPAAPPGEAEGDDTIPPITEENWEWWTTHLNAAAAEPERLAQLIPDTKDELWRLPGMLNHVAPAVHAAIYRKMIRWEPNNPWLYRNLTAYLPQQTRTEKLAVIRVWEEGKRVAKAQGHLIQTADLARLYCEVGEYEKGIAEAREQQTLIPELVKRIPHHHFVYVGLMRGPMIEHYEGLLEEQRAAGTVPVSSLPPRVSQLPFDGK